MLYYLINQLIISSLRLENEVLSELLRSVKSPSFIGTSTGAGDPICTVLVHILEIYRVVAMYIYIV